MRGLFFLFLSFLLASSLVGVEVRANGDSMDVYYFMDPVAPNTYGVHGEIPFGYWAVDTTNNVLIGLDGTYNSQTQTMDFVKNENAPDISYTSIDFALFDAARSVTSGSPDTYSPPSGSGSGPPSYTDTSYKINYPPDSGVNPRIIYESYVSDRGKYCYYYEESGEYIEIFSDSTGASLNPTSDLSADSVYFYNQSEYVPMFGSSSSDPPSYTDTNYKIIYP